MNTWVVSLALLIAAALVCVPLLAALVAAYRAMLRGALRAEDRRRWRWWGKK